MELVINTPWWFILLCLALGIAYSYLLYKPQFKDNSYKIMAVLRGLSVSLLAFFLLFSSDGICTWVSMFP